MNYCGVKFFKLFTIFLSGFFIGNYLQNKHFYAIFRSCLQDKLNESKFNENFKSLDGLYDESLSVDLFHEVKILCWVFTHPDNHRKKAIHVKDLWGKKCNKLLFMSVEEDPVLGTVVLPIGTGMEQLWNKTVKTFEYVHKHHLDDADWFMRLDDDTFAVMENIRYMLYQYRPQTSLYFGNRFTHGKKELGHNEGYMAGGAYVLSKKALRKLVEVLIPKNISSCNTYWLGSNQYAEDMYTGLCLDKQAIFVNELDELKQKRFFAVTIDKHFKEKIPNVWYRDYIWYNSTVGNLSCCSDTFCSTHYVEPKQLYELEYYVYHVHPFGIDKNSTEKLPRKLHLKEIIAASDIKGWGSYYTDHEPVHNLDSSEYF